jgi:hypothetical protein
MLGISSVQKWLIAWSILLLVAAEVVKHIHFGNAVTTIIGGLELMLAVLTGVAFALTTLKKDSQ